MTSEVDTRGGDGPTTGEKTGMRAQEAAHATKEGIGQVAEESRREGQRLLGEARDRVRGEADHRVRQAANSVRDVSTQLEAMASAPDQRGGMLPDLARQGATQLTGWADRLEQGGAEGAWQDLGAMARRRPGLFLAGAFGVGMVAGRVFRNTDTESVRRHLSEGGESEDADGASSRPVTTHGGPPAAAPGQAPTVRPGAGRPTQPGDTDRPTGLGPSS